MINQRGVTLVFTAKFYYFRNIPTKLVPQICTYLALFERYKDRINYV